MNPADGSQTMVSVGTDLRSPFGIAIVPGSPLPPGSCGGTVPCACGDRVVLDRTISGDP